MKNKSLLKECKCLHCQQKLDQINNSRLYWGKLILKKNQPNFLCKLFKIKNYLYLRNFLKSTHNLKKFLIT